MFEILLLPKQGNPDTDWSVYTTHYRRVGNARRTMYKLMHTGLYRAFILRDEMLQDRDDLIRRMNDVLRSDYNQRCNNVCLAPLQEVL